MLFFACSCAFLCLFVVILCHTQDNGMPPKTLATAGLPAGLSPCKRRTGILPGHFARPAREMGKVWPLGLGPMYPGFMWGSTCERGSALGVGSKASWARNFGVQKIVVCVFLQSSSCCLRTLVPPCIGSSLKPLRPENLNLCIFANPISRSPRNLSQVHGRVHCTPRDQSVQQLEASWGLSGTHDLGQSPEQGGTPLSCCERAVRPRQGGTEEPRGAWTSAREDWGILGGISLTTFQPQHRNSILGNLPLQFG